MGQSQPAISLTIILIVAFSMITLVGDDRPALACTCAPPVPIERSIDEAAGVFAGKVTALGRTDEPYSLRLATFDVDVVWKGNLNQSVVVATGQGSADCGYAFQLGKSYLVYAYGESGDLVTSDCAPTKSLAAADSDIAVLGRVSSPIPVERNTPQTALDISLMAISGMVVAAALGGFMFFRMRSRY